MDTGDLLGWMWGKELDVAGMGWRLIGGMLDESGCFPKK
jgi:hypothetical protein